VLTKDSAPIDWANAQNGLGTCLLNLSNFEQDAKYLPEAKAAFEATLLVFTKDYQPVQWAFAVNNVGDVHWSMGARGGGKPDFEKALANFEVARAYFDSAGYPQIVSLMDDKIKLIKDGLK
jgi:tetratricopeptide (TPR) repeat protein